MSASPQSPSGGLHSATLVQQNFQKFAEKLNEKLTDFKNSAIQFQTDLHSISSFVQQASDTADLTAEEFAADIANLSSLGVVGGGNPAQNLGPNSNPNSNPNG